MIFVAIVIVIIITDISLIISRHFNAIIIIIKSSHSDSILITVIGWKINIISYKR